MINNVKLLNAKTAILLFMSVVFVQMLILNILYPLNADDWIYTFIWEPSGLDNAVRVTNIMDIVESQYSHYMGWGGRVVAHVLAQFFLMFPPIVFDISNTVLFVLFIGLVYKIAIYKHQHNIYLLVLIVIAMWFFHPVFGSTTIWLTGSCNYLWCSFIIILFMYPYCRIYRSELNFNMSNSYSFILLMFIGGVAAGWTNENTSIGLIVFLFCILAVCKYSKKEIPLWGYSGVVGAIIGCCFLLLAPGNSIRMDAERDLSTTLISQLNVLTDFYIKFLLPPTILFFALIIYLYIYNRKSFNTQVLMIPFLCFIAAYIAFSAMIGSPYFPPRATFGAICFMIVGIAILYANIELNYEFFKYANLIAFSLGFIYYIYSYSIVSQSVIEMNKIWTHREQILEESKATGILDIKFDDLYIGHKKLDVYELDRDSTKWQNRSYSKFHGINSVKRKSTDDYKLGIYPQE